LTIIDHTNNNNSTDENIKTTAIIENNTKQKEQEQAQKQESTAAISMPKTKVNYNNDEFMVIQPTTINYLILIVRPSSSFQKEKKESLKNMISKIGKKAKNVIDE